MRKIKFSTLFYEVGAVSASAQHLMANHLSVGGVITIISVGGVIIIMIVSGVIII